MFQFDSSINDKDYFEFNKHYMKNAPANKKVMRYMRIFVPVGLVLLYIWTWLNGAEPNALLGMAVIYVGVALLWLFGFEYINLLFLKLNLKIMKKTGKLPYGKNSVTTFYEDHLVDITADIETKLKYSSIERVDIGETAVYIFYSVTQAIIIPFRAFQTADQQAAFYAFIMDKAEKNKLLTEK